jgi:hypothetical protein
MAKNSGFKSYLAWCLSLQTLISHQMSFWTKTSEIRAHCSPCTFTALTNRTHFQAERSTARKLNSADTSSRALKKPHRYRAEAQLPVFTITNLMPFSRLLTLNSTTNRWRSRWPCGLDSYVTGSILPWGRTYPRLCVDTIVRNRATFYPRDMTKCENFFN